MRLSLARSIATGNVVLAALLLVSPPTIAGSADDPFFARWETTGVDRGLPSNKVFAVVAEGPRIWAGTDKGLALLENGRTRVFGTAEGLPFPVVTTLALDRQTGDLWIGTMGGLARLSAGQIDAFTQLDSGLANNVVYGVAVDGSDVWIATAAGLNRYDGRSGTWGIFDTTNTLMHEPWCYGVEVAEGSVYVAVWGGGVVVRDRDTGRFRAHRDPDGEMEIDLFRDDGLVHDVTSGVTLANGVMWVGTYFGLSRYDGRRWNSYSESDSGLASDFINFVKASGDAVWIATDKGLSRFDSRTWHTWRRGEDGAIELQVTGGAGAARTMPLGAGPASDMIYAIDIQGDDVWLAIAAGLSHGIANPRSEEDVDE